MIGRVKEEAMGFLRRNRGSADAAAVPDWAEFMATAEYAEFRRLTGEWLGSHAPAYREFDGGGVEVTRDGDEPVVLRLSSLAHVCHAIPPSEWPGQIEEHLAAVFEGPPAAPVPTYRAVRSRLKVRIYPEIHAVNTRTAEPLLVYRPLAPGLQAVLVIDYPGRIAAVRPRFVEKWGRPVQELFETGLANVRQRDVPAMELLEESRIRILSGDSHFVTTWVLMLEQRLNPVPEHGAVVAIPHRHTVLFAPVLNQSVVNAVGQLLVTADLEFRRGPGSISPGVYWWRNGSLSLLAGRVAGRRADALPEEFAATMRSLPLPPR
jgi:PAS domain-containing protein